jgi:hypothetical protein
MGGFSEIHARISELIEAEAFLNELGWKSLEALSFRQMWQEAFEDLNRFFSPLEIREMMIEVGDA